MKTARCYSIGCCLLILAGAPIWSQEGVEELPGWEIEGALTVDALWNLSGGLKQDGAILGNLDFTAFVDTEAAGWWNEGAFFLYVLGNANVGSPPTELVGDVQATSNIEADETIKIYEAWYAHVFLNGDLDLLAGLHDYNSEFDVLEHAGLFMNSSFGISPDISQVGPSIFPTTAFGLRGKVSLGEKVYGMAAVYDGIPGDPNNPRGTHVRFDSGDGIFAAVEVGRVTGGGPGEAGYTKLAVGGWLHTADGEDVYGEAIDSNAGVYLIGERNLSDGTGIFGQLGITNERRNPIAWYLGGGITFSELVPGRPDDLIGLAVGIAVNCDDFLEANSGLNRTETAIEFTWSAKITDNLSVQPNIQYIIHPGQEPGLADALIAGVRTVLSF
jgi:porin